MIVEDEARTTCSAVETEEIRSLLDGLLVSG